MGRRGRIALTVVVGLGLASAVAVLRSGVEPPARPVIGPDGARIAAYHDSRLVTPPQLGDTRPQRPGELRTEARTRQALVSWAGGRGGYEVRWARTDGPGTPGLRYVNTSATTLSDLEPGEYRVEVRAVDDAGHRSEPSQTQVRVGDERPQWERGLGFLADLTAGSGGLDPDLWRGLSYPSQCLSRTGDTSPLLLSGDCYSGSLVPTSPLVLSDPDADGVRGRLLVVADTPPLGPPDGQGGYALLIAVGASGVAAADRVTLGLRPGGGYLAVGPDDVRTGWWPGYRPPAGDESGEAERLPGELDLPVAIGPGVVNRWELVFGVDQVWVLQNGTRVGSAPLRPSWRSAEVSITTLNGRPGNTDGSTPSARIELVGLTGPGPDGRATEIIELSPGLVGEVGPGSEFSYRPTPTAESARVTGRLFLTNPIGVTQPPAVTVEVGGRTVEPRVVPDQPGQFSNGYSFVADVPVEQVRAGGTVAVRVPNMPNPPDPAAGTPYPVSLYQVQLEITHQPGAEVAEIPVRLEPAPVPRNPRPQLRVLRDGGTVNSSAPVRRGPVDVEITVPQLTGDERPGWVAIRVELDGRRILDLPTGADGPAVTCGGLRFTLHTDDLDASYRRLQVTLIPAVAGVAPASDQYTLRLVD